MLPLPTLNLYLIAENMEAPTPRAISERLVKIRTTAKENGSAANFTVSSARKNGSAPSTPRKKATKDPVLKKAGGGGIKKKGIAKRKRAGKAENKYVIRQDRFHLIFILSSI